MSDTKPTVTEVTEVTEEIKTEAITTVQSEPPSTETVEANQVAGLMEAIEPTKATTESTITPVASQPPTDTSDEEQPLILNGQTFKKKQDVFDLVHDLQKKLTDDEELKGNEAFLIYDLFHYHSTSKDKINGGCTGIAYGPHDEFPETKSFYLKMNNGTKSSFSVKKCIEAVFGSQRLERREERRPVPEQRKRPLDTSEGRRDHRFKPEAGVLLHLKGSGLKELGFSTVKEHFPERNVKYIEFLEDESALVRFHSASDCKSAAESTEMIVSGVKCTSEVATEDVEKGFWVRSEEARERKRARMSQPAEPRKVKFTPGCLLRLTNYPSSVSISGLKEIYGTEEKAVRYVEFHGEDALIRFDSVEETNRAAKITTVNGTQVDVVVAPSEDEQAFYGRMAAAMAQRKNNSGGRGGRGGRGRGGGGYAGKRGHGRDRKYRN